MSDHQQAALAGWPALIEMLGQPGHTFDIQVVGGLIKHHDVPVLG